MNQQLASFVMVDDRPPVDKADFQFRGKDFIGLSLIHVNGSNQFLFLAGPCPSRLDRMMPDNLFWVTLLFFKCLLNNKDKQNMFTALNGINTANAFKNPCDVGMIIYIN